MTSMEFPIPLIEKERYPRFFFGQLKKLKGHLFCVRDVVTPGFISRYKSEFRLPSSTSDELMYKEMIDNWVVGLKGRYGPVLFEDKGLLAPVQVISWNYFEYRSVEPGAMRFLSDAIKYLSDTSTLEIHARDSLPLIGGKESIIIYDEVSNVFLKGFSYVGERKISCTNVSFLPSDDFLKVEEQNQASPITFGDACQFLLLVPETDNEYAKDKKHSVLDWRGWQSLDKYKLSVQKTEKLPSVEKDEDSVGERGAKWGQNEEEESDSRPAPAKPTISLPVSREISIRGAVVVKDLALKLGVRPNRLVADLMSLKILTSANQRIEPEAAIKVAQKYGYKVKVEHTRDAVNKKPVLKSINADDEIPQGNPENIRSLLASTSVGETEDDVGASPIPSAKGNTTYLFGPNVGGAIVAAKNEQNQKKAVNMPTDTIQKNTDGAKAQSAAEAASGTGKDETEVEFLTRFINAVKECGYHYAEQDLIRFHTSVKCGFLTVLGGAPGAGKSSLVKLYASAILGREGGKCRDGMLMVDVNSSWAEPADILGYWDLERHYRPSTGVVPFLRKAIRSEHLNIVCLEEMNLARVEHYFSDFMQLSEREIVERELKGVPLEPESKNQEEARLPIGKSVRIVGTNNFDQTTQRFSARFFDRCNYIELQDSRMNEDFLFSRPNIDQGNFNCTVSWDTYESWKKISPKVQMEKRDKGFVIKDENGKEILGEQVVERFKKIWGALKNLNLKPSPRVESSLVEYIVNRPFIAGYETECKSDYERQLRVLDEFVAQRILPRYTPSYLIDDSVERDALETALKDMTLSHNILNEKKSELDGKPHA